MAPAARSSNAALLSSTRFRQLLVQQTSQRDGQAAISPACWSRTALAATAPDQTQHAGTDISGGHELGQAAIHRRQRHERGYLQRQLSAAIHRRQRRQRGRRQRQRSRRTTAAAATVTAAVAATMTALGKGPGATRSTTSSPWRQPSLCRSPFARAARFPASVHCVVGNSHVQLASPPLCNVSVAIRTCGSLLRLYAMCRAHCAGRRFTTQTN